MFLINLGLSHNMHIYPMTREADYPVFSLPGSTVPNSQLPGYPGPVPVPKMYGDLLEFEFALKYCHNFVSSRPILTFKLPNPTKLRSRNSFLVSKVRSHCTANTYW